MIISTKRIIVKISRITREHENHFALDVKIEMITGLHGENEMDEKDPHAWGCRSGTEPEESEVG